MGPPGGGLGEEFRDRMSVKDRHRNHPLRRGQEGNRTGQREKVRPNKGAHREHSDLCSCLPSNRADEAFIPSPVDAAPTRRVEPRTSQLSAAEANPEEADSSVV